MTVRLARLPIWVGAALMATVTAVAILIYTAHWGFEAFLPYTAGNSVRFGIRRIYVYMALVASSRPV